MRGIELMYQLSGGKAEGHCCGDCENLMRCRPTDRVVYKCSIYGNTRSAASDWRKSYPACNWYNQERSEHNLIRCGFTDQSQASQCEGQVSLPGM